MKVEPTTENGIKKSSLIRLGKLTTLDKELVLGQMGKLSKDELARVDKSLIELFKLK